MSHRLFRSLRRPASLLVLLPALVRPATGQAPDHLNFWIEAGPARMATLSRAEGFALYETMPGWAAVGTIQSRQLVLSTRAAVANLPDGTRWDLGLLGGIGTSTAPPVYGSVAAGLGWGQVSRQDGSLTLPVEIQLGWRLNRFVGVGLYGFANFGGRSEAVGASLALRLGRLK